MIGAVSNSNEFDESKTHNPAPTKTDAGLAKFGSFKSVGEAAEAMSDSAFAASPPNIKISDMLHDVKQIKPHLVAVGIFSIFIMSRNLFFFPFLRTLVVCESTITTVLNPPLDMETNPWSGSANCNDIAYVAREAQLYKGLVEGFDQAVHCLMLPLLGHATDVFGRRWGVYMGTLSITVQILFYGIASVLPNGINGNPWGNAAFWCLVFGAVFQSATRAFETAVHASIADLFEKPDSKSKSKSTSRMKTQASGNAFAMMQISGFIAHGVALIILTESVLSKDLANYAYPWFVLTLVAVGSSVYINHQFPETLEPTNRPKWCWRTASPWSTLYVLSGSTFLETKTTMGDFKGVYLSVEEEEERRLNENVTITPDEDIYINEKAEYIEEAKIKQNMKWLSISLLIGMMGLSSLTVLQALMIARYHWSQTQATIVFAYLSPFGMISLLSSFVILPRYGALFTMGLAMILLNTGMVFLCFSTQAEWLLVTGTALILSSFGAVPAYFQLITDIAPNDRIGQYMAALGSISLAGIALGNILHSTIFKHGFYALPFVISLPLVLLSTVTGCKIHP